MSVQYQKSNHSVILTWKKDMMIRSKLNGVKALLKSTTDVWQSYVHVQDVHKHCWT